MCFSLFLEYAVYCVLHVRLLTSVVTFCVDKKSSALLF